MYGEVPGAYMTLTDDRAAGVIFGVKERPGNSLPSIAYHLDPDYTVVDHTIDAGEVQLKVNANVIFSQSLILALFPCTEFPVYSFDDTSLIGATTSTLGSRRAVSRRKRRSWPNGLRSRISSLTATVSLPTWVVFSPNAGLA